MALPSSGIIKFSNINTELGVAADTPRKLSDATTRTLFGVALGTIRLSNGYGKANLFSFNILSGTDLNVRTLAIAAGWNGTTALQATIPAGNTIQASTTGIYALTVNGAFPGGVTLVNNGLIVGRGGAGGHGANGGQGAGGVPVQQTPGAAGGPAVLVSVAVSINNIGTISGGGGGGGGGGADNNNQYGGGGGGGGVPFGAGAAGGNWFGPVGGPSPSGGTATLTTPGGGGAGVAGSGAGGTGGVQGTVGNTGARTGAPGGTGGGAAGTALSGNANVTWIAFGTRTGAIV